MSSSWKRWHYFEVLVFPYQLVFPHLQLLVFQQLLLQCSSLFLCLKFYPKDVNLMLQFIVLNVWETFVATCSCIPRNLCLPISKHFCFLKWCLEWNRQHLLPHLNRRLLRQLVQRLSIFRFLWVETYCVEFSNAIQVWLNSFCENIIVLCVVFFDTWSKELVDFVFILLFDEVTDFLKFDESIVWVVAN